jgi:hypothetical protein
MRAADLTYNQRRTICRVVRLHREGGRSLAIRETGAPAAVRRMERMGLVLIHRSTGPRGGTVEMVDPTVEGYRVADYITAAGLRTW